MIVLGLHYGHDGAACIVKDGRLVAALASERLTRQKKSAGVTDATLDAVLETAGVTVDDIDALALTDWYAPWSQGTLEVRERTSGALVDCTWDQIWDDEVRTFDATLRGRTLPAYNVGHQKAHCASAYYTSPYGEAWCVSMDASGAKPKNNFMVARGRGNRLDWVDTPLCLVGVLYGFVCEWLGIGAQMYKAGSMMALAGYGAPFPSVVQYRHEMARAALFDPGGDYHAWMRERWKWLSNGRPFDAASSDGPEAQAIAASVQLLFEEAILEALTHVPNDGCNALCLAGGSFLNCNANARVARESRFGPPHLFPACTDDGCPVGAALYVAHHLFDEPRARYTPRDLAYLGPRRAEGPVDVERVVDALTAGQVVGWFQGRSEYGPRALGHRSLLADPRRADMRDRINQGIKHREWYRPLSPSVTVGRSAEWFDWPGDSPYMLFTAPCPRAEEVPAVVHVDGSARMQTVHALDNLAYRQLLACFEERTGVPMLLNTSLNVDGQPIVETEDDARAFWAQVPVDMMVVGGEVWER